MMWSRQHVVVVKQAQKTGHRERNSKHISLHLHNDNIMITLHAFGFKGSYAEYIGRVRMLSTQAEYAG